MSPPLCYGLTVGFYFLLAVKLLATEQAINKPIVIKGKRPEVFHPKRAGLQTTVRPSQASRFQSRPHLNAQSSIHLQENGQVSASGFVVPRIRGQESKQTDIYLENLRLYDPFTGLPSSHAIDLEAFGELNIYQGISPPSLPGLNLIGTLHYKLRPITKKKQRAGITWGQPYGIGLSSLWENRETRSSTNHSYRLYLRHHQTSGKFPYYSDNSTPYNPTDDRTLMRLNNDSRSVQLLSTNHLTFDNQQVMVLAWINQRNQGIPTLNANLPSLARQKNKSGLLQISYTKWLLDNSTYKPDKWTLTGGIVKNQKQLQDPKNTFLPNKNSTGLEVSSFNIDSSWHWLHPPWQPTIGLQLSRAEVSTQIDGELQTAAKRSTIAQNIGVTAQLSSHLKWEFKEVWSQLFDEFSSQSTNEIITSPPINSRHKSFWGLATGLYWQVSPTIGVYSQIGSNQRHPSLLEEFGDGALVLGNSDLNAESVNHGEAGIVWTPTNSTRLSLIGFGDQGKNKILFTRSLGNTVRAKNIQDTFILGSDIQLSSSTGSWNWHLGLTKVQAHDKTGKHPRLLPNTSEWSAAFANAYQFRALTLRWQSRYSSEVFLDANESIVVPAAHIHDIYLDTEFTYFKPRFKLGVACINLFNTSKLPIRAPRTEESGYTSYSSIRGFPLPGRQWQISISGEI